MADRVWKEFEENQLTHSAAHYLMAIMDLLQDKGYARVTDVARRLNITRGSCSIGLKSLKRKGLVEEDENRFLVLSDEGRRLAELVEYNDELLETFFRDVLGVDPEQAEIDACKIEHLISIETSLALNNFIKLFQSDKEAAEAFVRTLKRHNEEACIHDVKNCTTCKSFCFLDGESDAQIVEIAPVVPDKA